MIWSPNRQVSERSDSRISVQVPSIRFPRTSAGSHASCSDTWTRFLLVIDGKIMLNAYGTGGCTDVFPPALREIVARRAGHVLNPPLR